MNIELIRKKGETDFISFILKKSSVRGLMRKLAYYYSILLSLTIVDIS